MATLTEVPVPPLSLERLRGLIDGEDWRRFETGIGRARALLGERTLWNVNSTAAGGGVAELLWSWVGLAQGVGVSMRWLTISGSGRSSRSPSASTTSCTATPATAAGSGRRSGGPTRRCRR